MDHRHHDHRLLGVYEDEGDCLFRNNFLKRTNRADEEVTAEYKRAFMIGKEVGFPRRLLCAP